MITLQSFGGNTSLTKDDYKNILLRVCLQEEAHNKKIKGFSKGMRQKCGIAIAIIKSADAILLDEPTSGLDPKAGFEFISLLKSLRDEGKAILMSTHDIFRAKEISDTIGIMNKGKLVMLKRKDELKDQDLEHIYLDIWKDIRELLAIPFFLLHRDNGPDLKGRVRERLGVKLFVHKLTRILKLISISY